MLDASDLVASSGGEQILAVLELEAPQLSQTALGRGSLLGSRVICVLALLKFRRSTLGYVYQICELMA